MYINRWSGTGCHFQVQGEKRESKQHYFLKAEVDSHEPIDTSINKTNKTNTNKNKT